MVTDNKGPKIKNIVIEIDLIMFSYGPTDNIFDYNTKANYFAECLSLHTLAKAINTNYFSRWLRRCFPLIGHGEDFGHLTYLPTNQEFINGYQPYVGDLTLDYENITRIALNFHTSRFEKIDFISDVHFDYFIKILKLAKENNIKVILIRFPMPKEYEEAHKQFNFSEDYYYDTIFRKVDLIFGKDYTVLNYYALFFNETNYFGDITHLNGRGANKLSKKIYSDLRTLDLINQEN